MKAELDRLILEHKLNKRNKVVLFGANKSSVMIMEMLSEYHISAIVDNDVRKHGQDIQGVMVYSPKDFLGQYDENIRIIIASEYYSQMCEQLQEMGYTEGKEVFVVWRGPGFYDISEGALVSKIQVAEKGKQVYESLKNKHSFEYLFICPYAGTGDIYIIGLYLDEYIRKHNISKYCITVVGKACSKVAKLFSKECEVISVEESDCLVSYVRMLGMQHVKVLNDAYQQNMVKRLRGYKGLDFNRLFQTSVFGMEQRVEKIKIKQQAADEYFSKYNLKKGNTILLSPYANTIVKLPDAFWESLAEMLMQKGYTVCTNSSGEHEPAIAGTQGVFVPYNQIIDFVDKAGGFVGMRSGLCDIISSTTAGMVILYPSGNLFGACSTYDYFSLEKMGLKNQNISEIEFEKPEECYEAVYSFF